MYSTIRSSLARFMLLALACIAAGQLVDAEAESKPAEIGVYFESRCPDSRRFFVDQLVPTYRKIGSIMKLKLVPFGHARTLGQNKMICQHGAKECEGNRLMACIMAKNASDSVTIETIGCMFSNPAEYKECVETRLPGVSFDELQNCKASEESYQMMVKFEEMTGRLDYVPHLTYNNQSSEEIQNECENNLKDYVCKNHQGTKPDGCK